MAGRIRIWRAPGCLLFVLIVVLPGCSSSGSQAARQPLGAETSALSDPGTPSASSPSSVSPTAADPTAVSSPAPSPTVSRTAKPSATPTAAQSGLTALDHLAGLRSNSIPWRGGGTLITVPGHSAAPGKGRIYTVEVQVESGLNLDRAAFARFVLATLNDPRSWTEHGTRRFARTNGPADIRVVLASPATSAAICLPLHTFGKLSCRSGANTAVLTYYRWVKAIPGYDGDRDGYRHYVINHEVGHVLGHHHQYCAGRGKLAPLMMQQTKGLKGCRPNPWPHP